MRRLGLLVAAFLVFAVSPAAGAAPHEAWTSRDMVKALKALGYPKSNAKKLTCKGLTRLGRRYSSFNCVATYRRRIGFYAAGRGKGGWICAGAKLATCKVLRHGFIAFDSNLNAVFAAEGYVENKYQVGKVVRLGPCSYTDVATTCKFGAPPGGDIIVAVKLKPATGGDITGASSTLTSGP